MKTSYVQGLCDPTTGWAAHGFVVLGVVWHYESNVEVE